MDGLRIDRLRLRLMDSPVDEGNGR
jgi:hypothetical protein